MPWGHRKRGSYVVLGGYHRDRTRKCCAALARALHLPECRVKLVTRQVGNNAAEEDVIEGMISERQSHGVGLHERNVCAGREIGASSPNETGRHVDGDNARYAPGVSPRHETCAAADVQHTARKIRP